MHSGRSKLLSDLRRIWAGRSRTEGGVQAGHNDAEKAQWNNMHKGDEDKFKRNARGEQQQQQQTLQTEQQQQQQAVATMPSLPVSTLPPVSSSSSSSSFYFPLDSAPIPILVFTFNRPDNLRETLLSLLSHRPLPYSLHPVYISQDGTDESTRRVAREFVDNTAGRADWSEIFYLNFHWESSGVQVEPQHAQWGTYYKIATHYGWAIRQVMDEGGGQEGQAKREYNKIILVEDDMHVAPDFFHYFRRLHTLLDSDPSLLCVSAWNDNGRSPLVSSSTQLYRSDCFPGLGWMMGRSVWDEMKSKWPKGFWDDWLREPQQRKGRNCIFPQMNRVYTFGEKGSSAGQFYDQYLRDIKLNPDDVDWSVEDLSYLSSADAYRSWLHSHVAAARTIYSVGEVAGIVNSFDYQAETDDVDKKDNSKHEFRMLYRGIPVSLNMMIDHKAGIPRTSFDGVLSFVTTTTVRGGQQKHFRVWIVPEESPLLH